MLLPRVARSFPSLAGMAYLNSAAEGFLRSRLATRQRILPRQAARGRTRLAPAMLGRSQGTHRGLLRALGRGDRNLLLFIRGVQPRGAALRLKEGDEVVVNDLDFPSGATPWLQPSCPATSRVWRNRAGALRVDDLVPLLNTRTRLVTVSLVSFFNGFRIHLPEVVATVRKASNALLAVDG